jgi:type I restriction enzyme S subunit
MNNWKEEILSEHIGLRHGYQFRETDFTENGIQVIKIGNVTSDGLSLSANVSYVSSTREKEFESIIIREGDILMSLTGNIGRVVEVNNLGNKILFQNYRVGVFYPLKDNISKPFIKWILSSEEILRQLNSNSNQSAQANFGKQDLDKLKFKIPSITEQEKISKILTTTESVIVKTQAAIAKYKAIKQGMLNDLFTRGIDIKTGKLRPKQEDAPELYKESELGWIPKEWDDKCLSSLCSEKPTYGINAAAVDYNHHLPTYLRITDIDEDGNFSKTRKKCVDSSFSNNYILKKGDLVFARTGATVGKTYLYNESDGQLVFAGFLIKVSPNDKLLDSNFLKFLTETPYYINWVEVMSQRSGQPGINGNEYGNFLVPKPDLTEQKIIAERLLSIQNKISYEQQFLFKLQQIKSGLMADLLSGNKLVSIPKEMETQTT